MTDTRTKLVDRVPIADQITAIVYEGVVSALQDFEIPDEIIRNDPEIRMAAQATADAIIAALPDMVVPLAWTVRDEKTQFAIRRYVAKNYIIEERLYGDCFDLWIGVNATSAVRFNSIKEAKAAANAHYRAAILAALGVNT